MKCKFCGKEITTEKYLNPESEKSCGKCTQYCMRECEIAKSTTTSWHKEPCTECEHNPYRMNHFFYGERWVKNAQ